jgi:uncharacterized SAM-binding protein YcdF (DUF218 family)
MCGRMSRIVTFVFSLSGLLTCLLAAVTWQWRRPGSAAARRVLVAVVGAHTAASIYAVPYAVGRLPVLPCHEFSEADVPDSPTAIVPLGVGNTTIHGWDGGHLAIQEPTGASRVLEAARVSRLMGNPLLISSGGLIDPRPLDEPSAITMRNALIALGIPGSSVLIEDQSPTTRDEAVIVASMLRARGIERVVLVTSDIHMRWSMATFRAQGIDAVPAAAPDPEPPMDLYEWVFPTARGLDRSSKVVHEFLGLMYYAARG